MSHLRRNILSQPSVDMAPPKIMALGISNTSYRADITESSSFSESERSLSPGNDVKVLVELPPNFSLLQEEKNTEVCNANPISYYFAHRARAAHRRQLLQEQRRQRSCLWDEDNVSSAAVRSDDETSHHFTIEEDLKEAHPSLDPPPPLVIESDEAVTNDHNGRQFKKKNRQLLFGRLFARKRNQNCKPCTVNSSKTEKALSEHPLSNISSATLYQPSPLNTTMGVADFRLSRKQQVIQARRAKVGFARIIAMDGILESHENQATCKLGTADPMKPPGLAGRPHSTN